MLGTRLTACIECLNFTIAAALSSQPCQAHKEALNFLLIKRYSGLLCAIVCV